MKKNILLIALLFLSTSIFAEHLIQFSVNKDIYTMTFETSEPVLNEGLTLFPIHFEGGSLSYCYKFPSENKFNWLVGGDIGWNNWGPNFCVQGGFSASVLESDNFNLDLQFLTKLALFMYKYGDLSLDVVCSHKKLNTFFYGVGINSSVRGTSYKTESLENNYKIIVPVGVHIFCGYKFGN